MIIDISVSRPCLKSTCQRRRPRDFHAVDVRCSDVHSIDPANAVASSRIEFGRKLHGAAGSYGRAIGADDQNQYAGVRSFVRSVGSSARRSSPLLHALARFPSQSRSCQQLFGLLAEPTALGRASPPTAAAGMSDSCRATPTKPGRRAPPTTLPSFRSYPV